MFAAKARGIIRLASVASAFERRRIGPGRPRWVRSGRRESQLVVERTGGFGQSKDRGGHPREADGLPYLRVRRFCPSPILTASAERAFAYAGATIG